MIVEKTIVVREAHAEVTVCVSSHPSHGFEDLESFQL